MPIRLAVDDECVGFRKLGLVAVDSTEAHKHAVATPKLLTLELRIPRNGARERLDRREVAEELLGGAGDQRRSLDQPRSDVPLPVEEFDRVREQRRGRVD